MRACVCACVRVCVCAYVCVCVVGIVLGGLNFMASGGSSFCKPR